MTDLNNVLWAQLTDEQRATAAPSPNGNGRGDGPPPSFSTWADIDGVIGPITWAWPGWLPDAMLTELASEPGVGKSAVALRTAATMIGAFPTWPDGTPFTGEPGRIVWAEAEAGQAINLERARAWGLDLEKIIQPGLPLEDFKLDDPAKWDALKTLAYLPDVRLIVIDSLSGANTRRENDTEQQLSLVKQLAELARDCGRPILLTHHLRKRGIFDSGEPSLEQLRGAVAITQPARVVWVIDAPDLQDKETRRLSQVKNNLQRMPGPLGLTIGPAGVTFVDAPEAPQPINQQDQAINFLLALLQDEAMPAAEVFEQAQLAGHSRRTIERAKGKIGVVSLKGQGGQQWLWGLPAKS
jgi:hypothetical protein